MRSQPVGAARGGVLALLIALDASLAPLISPPVSWVVLQFLVWPVAIAILGRTRGAAAFALGWLGGIVVHLRLLAWLPDTIVAFTGLPFAVAWVAHLLHAALFGAFLGFFALGLAPVRRAFGSGWPIGVAAWFAACEFANPAILPYHQADAWLGTPSLFLVTALTGPSGGTFLVLLCGSVLLQAVECARARAWSRIGGALVRNAAIAVALVALAWIASALRLRAIEHAEAAARPVRVALVQSGQYGDARRALLASGGAEALALDLVELSRSAGAAIDAYVWPEQALAGPPMSGSHVAVLQFAQQREAEIWTGAGFSGRHRDDRERPMNAAFRIDAGGMVDRRYDKRVLVPFAEFAPFADAFPALGRLPGAGRLLPGETPAVFESPLARFAFLICYEAILPGVVRDAWRDGAELLVNVTFDGWFGDTAAPHQHLMLAAIQAARFGIPAVRSATTGVSAFIDARGAITLRSRLFTRDVLLAEVRPLRLGSPYAAWGDWFGAVLLVVSGAVLAADAAKRRRAGR